MFQVLAVFQEVGVNKILYFLVFGESLLNGILFVEMENFITVIRGLLRWPLRQML